MKKKTQKNKKGIAKKEELNPFAIILVSGYYPTTCDDVPPHTCDPCEPREFGRIRSAGFINSNSVLLPENGGDPTNASIWQSEQQLGNAIVVPFTNGEMPAPSEKTVQGYGDVVEEVTTYDFQASFSDPNFISNQPFYNAMIGKRNFYFFFRTSSQVYLTPVAVTVIPKFKVDNDLNSEVVWTTMVKWVSNQMPELFPIPDGVFDQCFELGN